MSPKKNHYKSKLKLSQEELRREVRHGQRQGWLMVLGTGRSTRYQLVKPKTKV